MAYNDVSQSGMNYVTLKQVIDDFIITLDGDDYVSNASDAAIRNFALRGIRELGFDVSKRIKSLKLTVDSSTQSVALPDDYVDAIKLAIVGSDGLLRVLGANRNINYSSRYELDSSGVATGETSDSEEGPLDIEANLVRDIEPSKSATGGGGGGGTDEALAGFDSFIFRNYVYDNNVGRLYGAGGGHLAGDYRINLADNRIELELNTNVTEVVIEYIADEARSTNPVVHVYLEEALRSYIYYKLCERKSSVPANEKARARAEYYNERRKANARMSNFTKEEALKTIRSNYKQSPKY
jgi:hypothetical protein